ncbi:MAG: hypothetical protein V8R46_03930 [Eubacterium ramulus]
MDKTGTITEGNFVLQKTMWCSAAGFDDERLLALAGSCETTSTHPIAVSIVTAAEEKTIGLQHPLSVEEISGIAGHGIVAENTVKALYYAVISKLLAKYHVELGQYSDASYGTEVLLAVNGVYRTELWLLPIRSKQMLLPLSVSYEKTRSALP